MSFHNVRTFVRSRFGVEGWEAVCASLERADLNLLEGATSTAWYSLEAWARLIRVMDKVLGQGDLALCAELGRAGAERDITPVLRALLKLISPHHAILKLTDLWSRHHDTGTWTVRVDEKAHIVIALDDWGVIDRALCVNLEGYLGRFAHRVGAINARTQHIECRDRGGKSCVFDISW
jgi:predicted hydrocarbon binding protein